MQFSKTLRSALWMVVLAAACAQAQGQAGKAASSAADSARAPQSAAELEQRLFAIVRSGDALQFLGYVPEDGVNLGRDAQYTTRDEIEDQLTHRTGLYCKLFDSACMTGAPAPCSYRELLTQSEKVRTASTETTRNGVRQAILVAQVQNQKCGGAVLIDFIFNYHQGGWKLFSIP